MLSDGLEQSARSTLITCHQQGTDVTLYVHRIVNSILMTSLTLTYREVKSTERQSRVARGSGRSMGWVGFLHPVVNYGLIRVHFWVGSG